MRIDYDALEPSEDHLLLLYQGSPFTGVAFETDREGRLVAEVEFRDGQKAGLAREWFPGGGLSAEYTCAFGAYHGLSRQWYESGAPRAEGVYELGICLRRREWSVDGRLTSEMVLAEGSPQYETLRLLRASTIGRLVDER